MSPYCQITPGCERPRMTNMLGCYTCEQAERKRKQNASKVKVVKPIRKVSVKRAAEEREYYKLEKQFLEDNPCCGVKECYERSTQCHHKKGRENDLLLEVQWFFPVCAVHHEKITRDSKWAIENGYSLPRNH